MHLTKGLVAATALLAGGVSAAPAPAGPATPNYSGADISNGNALKDLNKKAYDAAMAQVGKVSARDGGSSCTTANIKIRREWRTLSADQRKSYIAAVKCVQGKPSTFPPGTGDGIKSLYDDFVAVHMAQTGTIHLTATFLTWHRYYIHAYEQKLNACGYNGAIPYWEWGLDTSNIKASPLFDGSATSLSGDGAFVQHGPLMLPPPFAAEPVTVIPPGQGGGCVTSGPFKDMVVHLGPIALPVPGTTNFTGISPPAAFYADNPRCLRRDLSTNSIARFANFGNTTSLILNQPNIELFQAIMQADPRYNLGAQLGVHGGGHYGIGGNPGGDVFISPGDPAFYLHHAQIDRVYWLWQLLDFPNRQNVWGTGTILNQPPSPSVTVNDNIDISPLAPSVQIKNLMNTVTGSPLCYVYL